MKLLLTLFVLLASLMSSVVCEWDEIKQCRTVQKKRRGYRAGFVDPMEMMSHGKPMTADDLHRGTIETRDDLPSIEHYVLTNFGYHQRKRHEQKTYDVEDSGQWDQYFKNVTEVSREHYDFYIASPEDGKYQFKNQSYLVIFGLKDDEETLMWGHHIGSKQCELNRQGIIPIFVDIMLDPMLSATFNRKFTPQVFMLWNETENAYAFDYKVRSHETVDWALSGDFKNSSLIFKTPAIMSWRDFKLYNFKDKSMQIYFKLIGNFVMKYIHEFVPKSWFSQKPFSWIIDHDRTDIFQQKFLLHFHGFLVVLAIASFINLQIFRCICCRRKIVIRKKKRVDRDTQ